MAITIKDIARQAGVTHATVSRALHASPLISSETSERIRKIAAELGYQPSAAARSLKTNRSQAVGVILSHIADPFFSEILQGIDDIAQQHGYSLFIAASQRSPARERAIVKTMREHRVDGVIICSTPFSAEQSRLLLSYDIPIVVINNQSAEDYRYSIYHDDLAGSQAVTQHLIDLGHQRIAYLGNAFSGRTNQERLSGFQAQMQAAGLPLPEGFVHEVAGSDPEQGLSGAGHFLALPERPTAIFCFNDLLATGLLRGLHQAGLSVPRDCSVAGFDNIAASAYTQPPLTTFDQPKREIGIQAAQLLLDLLNPANEIRPGPSIQTLRGTLLVRESTGPRNG
jgi:LacI family transcriptional regulator/LacI family repressor for deo operon, udp, cdd, tsx, nupC, and nupG